jgi:transcriptional regulator with GAF, ATPase, and Fis domain
LKNVIERAVILSRGKVLRLDLAMNDILTSAAVTETNAPEGVVRLMTESELLDLERRNTLLALERAQWRVSGPNGAAELLGVKPTTLADRMKKLKLRKPTATPPRSAAERRQPA